MAKKKGEISKGTHCDRCGKVTSMKDRVLLRSLEYYRDEEKYPFTSSNHSTRIVDSYGFCRECYKHIYENIELEIDNCTVLNS